MSQEARFPLRISTGWRVLFFAVGLFCLLQAVVVLGSVQDVRELGAAAMTGVAGYLVLRLVLRNSGVIIFREDGLVLDSHVSTGLIPWDDLEEPRPVRIWGMDYLGLSTRNPGAYVQSRQHLQGLINERDRQWSQGLLRGAYLIIGFVPSTKKAIDAALAMCGWSKLPERLTESNLMDWQQENYGAQIVIQRFFVPDFEQIQSKLALRYQGHRASEPGHPATVDETEPAEATTIVPLAGPHHRPAGKKRCPMCAELVLEEARLCRFCRYSFEQNVLLPPA